MSETPDTSAPVPGQLPPPTDAIAEQTWHMGPEEATALREAQVGWLERRGIQPVAIPPMNSREHALFRAVGEDEGTPQLMGLARKLYGIPSEDQCDTQYVLVDMASDDPSQPPVPSIMIVMEADFGTLIDPHVIAKDFQSPDADAGPDSPPQPETPGGTYRIINIADTIVASTQGIKDAARVIMDKQTVNPLNSDYGDIGVRAGGLFHGQQDAYFWTSSPYTKSVELTIAFPYQYDSVCVIRGERREPGNGKAGMAQMMDPEVVLKIEGEGLRRLQQVYGGLYHEPDFAITEAQRNERDQTFNAYLASLITQEAHSNQARVDEERRIFEQPLQARERPL